MVKIDLINMVLPLVLSCVLITSCTPKQQTAVAEGNGSNMYDLWSNTVAVHLEDELWNDENIYDAGNYLMVPLHAAFKLDESEWQMQFAYHFERFMENNEHISGSRLNQLHYYYLISQFIVLATDHGRFEIIPEGMADYVYNRIYRMWFEEPAWQ